MAMLELAVAIARGDYWLMHKCSRGRVLFVNFEIDPASFKKRVHAYCLKRGIRLDPGMMEIWNLRGHLIEPKSFAENLIRYCRGKHFSAILLDPIYKMMEMQDENNAADISQMCNLFDKITMETDASIIFSHHFSKGSKYNTSAIDRASGSGVFARDPDAIIVFSLLDWTPPEETPYKTAVRVEMILREFPSPAPRNFFFDYPLHEYDEENILIAMYAHKRGLKRYITKVNRTELLEILGEDRLKAIITPGKLIADTIVRLTRAMDDARGKDVEALYRLVDNQVEALQFFVPSGSKVLGKALRDLPIKNNVLIAAIMHNGVHLFPSGNDMLHIGDIIIVTTTDHSLRSIDDILEKE